MPTYKSKGEDTEINGADAEGNVWPEPLVFKGGTITVPDDQQDVVAALESAVGAGVLERVKEPAAKGKEK
jgi:hypothetical protein